MAVCVCVPPAFSLSLSLLFSHIFPFRKRALAEGRGEGRRHCAFSGAFQSLGPREPFVVAACGWTFILFDRRARASCSACTRRKPYVDRSEPSNSKRMPEG